MLATITDPLLLALYLPSVNYSDNFSIDIAIDTVFVDDVGVTTTLPAILIEPTELSGLKVLNINSNKIRVSGSHILNFSDQYIFVDSSGLVQPGDPLTEMNILVEYTMPGIVLKLIDLQFAVTVPVEPSLDSLLQTVLNIELHQWVYWNTTAAAENIERLIKR